MSTRERTRANDRDNRWVLPTVSVVVGLGYLVAGLVAGRPGFAWGGLGIMVAFAAVILIAGRYSETARGLLDRRDERINAHDRDAALLAGCSVLIATVGMLCLEVARGRDGSPYYQLAALGGVVYVGALLWQRWRR